MEINSFFRGAGVLLIAVSLAACSGSDGINAGGNNGGGDNGGGGNGGGDNGGGDNGGGDNGGGGNGGGDNGGGGNGPASFEEMAIRGFELVDRAEGLDPTPVDNMPTTGTATYQGIAAFALEVIPEVMDDIEILSELTLNANFASSSITGSMDNFRDFEDEALTGSLAIENGMVTGGSFTADAAGALGWQGEQANVALDMLGEFGGENYEMVIGSADGTATPTGGDPIAIYGGFIAEKQ